MALFSHKFSYSVLLKGRHALMGCTSYLRQRGLLLIESVVKRQIVSRQHRAHSIARPFAADRSRMSHSSVSSRHLNRWSMVWTASPHLHAVISR